MKIKDIRHDFMFKKVECKAYLKEVKDGAHIEERIDGYYFCQNDNERKLEKPGDGGEKEYYQRIENTFSGVVVGIKEISIIGRLFIGETIDIAGSKIGHYIGKEPVATTLAALVYYANLRKRWVPLKDILVFEKGVQLSMDLGKED